MSITREHLIAVVNTETKGRGNGPVRLLDLGCGDGVMLQRFALKWPEISSRPLECYGLDVSDHGVQAGGYFAKTIDGLAKVAPAVNWAERLQLVSTSAPWPWRDGFFDVIVSNQVMEHVDDHPFVLSELRRCLRIGGFSAHLFPLEHCMWEGHIHLPFYHWIRDHDLRVAYVKLALQLGLKKRNTNLSHRDAPIARFAAAESDVMRDFTNYMTLGEAHRLAHRAKLRLTFRYTMDYYLNVLRSKLRRPLVYEYSKSRSAIVDRLALTACSRVSSVCMFLENSPGERQGGGEFLAAVVDGPT